MTTGGVPNESLLTFFGGGGQDAHYYALLQPLAGGASKLLNTVASTINGVPTSTVLNFHIHAMQIDKSGRYIFIYPSGADLGSPRFASQVYLWDTVSDAIVALTPNMHPAGHDAAGFGVWINQDCCTSSSWDAAQWQFRSLATPLLTSDLISPILTPQEVYMADHTTWNNAQPDRLVPVISSTYRYGSNSAPWRAWDDEIIAIDTTGAGTVWRFAHHRSNIGSDSNPLQPVLLVRANREHFARRQVGAVYFELGENTRSGFFRGDRAPGRFPRPVDPDAVVRCLRRSRTSEIRPAAIAGDTQHRPRRVRPFLTPSTSRRSARSAARAALRTPKRRMRQQRERHEESPAVDFRGARAEHEDAEGKRRRYEVERRQRDGAALQLPVDPSDPPLRRVMSEPGFADLHPDPVRQRGARKGSCRRRAVVRTRRSRRPGLPA